MTGQLVKISTLFNICYGHQLDLNKQIITINDGISFVTRSANNLGVSCKIKKIPNIQPFKKGLITVSLGGSILASYIQPDDFYTGQNIKVLEPKIELSYNQLLFYCICIKANAYKYSAFGREANKTFNDLLIPDVCDIPKWVENIRLPKEPSKKPYSIDRICLYDREWKDFKLAQFFNMYSGKYYPSNTYTTGSTPLISASSTDNGVKTFTTLKPLYQGNCLTIGKIEAATHYQGVPFIATSDATVLVSKTPIVFNNFIGMFLTTLLNLEGFKWSYGRQIRLNDSLKLRIKLPIDNNGNPDWQFMEDYIKSLPYSSNL